MHDGDYKYRLGANTDSSIFSSIFALFCRDLFDDIDHLDFKKKQAWAEFIQSYQDPETGLFFLD